MSVWYNHTSHTFGCAQWYPGNHILFQFANAAVLIASLAPPGTLGILFLHGTLLFGFLLFCTWAWVVLCAPDIFSWNFAFMLINAVQLFAVLYQLRPTKFNPEIEDIYQTLFAPLKVPRNLVKKLCSPEYATRLSLYQGEPYATQDVTRCDRLGLLLSGTATVVSNNHFLHHIRERQFFDSPEFEASNAGEEKYQVTIVAATPCRYIMWQREALQYLFIKEPYLAVILATIIGRDITNKLYAMNEKVKLRGTRLDIRLPSVTSLISNADAQRPSMLKQRLQNLQSRAESLKQVESEDSADFEESPQLPRVPYVINGRPNNFNNLLNC